MQNPKLKSNVLRCRPLKKWRSIILIKIIALDLVFHNGPRPRRNIDTCKLFPEPEVLDGLGADGELDGGTDRPQLEELRRELVAHEATHVGIVAVRGDVGLQEG